MLRAAMLDCELAVAKIPALVCVSDDAASEKLGETIIITDLSQLTSAVKWLTGEPCS